MIDRVKQIGISRIILTIYFTFLCGISGAAASWGITESVLGTFFATIFGVILGIVVVDGVYRIRGQITLAMVVGTAIGALLAIVFFNNPSLGFNKEREGSLFVILAVGSCVGLLVGTDIHNAIQRAKKWALWGALIGSVPALGYLTFGASS